jgi:hypothetical protein
LEVVGEDVEIEVCVQAAGTADSSKTIVQHRNTFETSGRCDVRPAARRPFDCSEYMIAFAGK